MRRCLAMLLAVLLCFSVTSALAEEFSLAGYDGGSSTTHDWSTNYFFTAMQERTGVTVSTTQYTELADWTKAKAAMLSGETELPDALFKAELTPTETLELYEAGKLIDLRPYLEEYMPNLYALLQEHPDWEKAISMPDGAIVALPLINELQNNNAMWINRSWLDKLGLEVPTTADELTEVLRAFRDGDPNGNGKKDEVPLEFLSMWDLRFLGHAFGLVSDDYNLYVDENGQVQTTLTKDENRAFLTWLHELWEEGLLDTNGFTTADSLRAITDSDADITYGVMLAPTPLSLTPSSALSQYELLMPLTYNGEQVYRDLLGDVVRGTFAVTSACENPGTVLSWIDYLYTEEGCHLVQAGEEGVDYQFNSDGTWNWIPSNEEVTSSVLPDKTIADGGTQPGFSSVSFQLAFDQKETKTIITQLAKLKEISVQPMPLVTMNKTQSERVSAIQADLGSYAEITMTRFVTGDIPLNDDTWQNFCQTVQEKGMDELISIWQEAIQ